MSTIHRGRRRRGAALIESVLTTTAFLTLVMGMIDLGVFVFRSHVIANAARQGVRAAVVHGSLAPSGWRGGPWGTTTYGPVSVSSDLSNPKVQAISPYLSGLNPSNVQVTYEWPDGSNLAEKNIRVTVSTTWSPLLTSIFGAGARTITARSTMFIAH